VKTRWLAIVAIVGVFGACGGDDDAAETTAPAGDVTETTDATDSIGASDSTDSTAATEPPASDETSVPATEPPSDETSVPATEPETEASGDAGCHVDVTGGLEASWDGPDDDAAVTTDYWYSEAELLQQVEIFAEEGTDPEAELATKLETGEPIFSLLLMNCPGPDGGALTFTHSSATTRATLPMGPGTYPLGGGLVGGEEGPAGTMSVLVVMPGEAEADSVWMPEGEGTFEITRWDNSGIEGSFSFGVAQSFVDPPRQATVNGTFAFTCKASTTCG
jgi:hypothetical protein